ncbi:reverse transcriptase-like protein [Nitzschia inconspicua]|uniref:Reverse transcriptase-like protein n=1 Tax=Nitzschia inconspicua TaxID=303405 RepID=A0A9K3KAD2_9STRA|nr:reverse transcriptase-like protein [Nitzschia inconspicua]KAG7357450.1 reverse transcriptase-like protein [Nitzschia inconspicua]
MISVLSLASPSLPPPQQQQQQRPPQPLHSQQQTIVRRTVIITLQFDGSFRPPKDFGHTTIPRRFAVAAACVSLDTTTTTTTTTNGTATRNNETTGNGKVRPMAVAARILPTVPFDMTSQHAEYEGLLLGLRHVNDQWQKWVNCDQQKELQIQNHHQVAYATSSNKEKQEQDSIGTKSKCHKLIVLRIQGDCKTVIDQLSGKAVPRRLERLWKEAQDQLERIQQQQQQEESHTDDFSLVMEYELLPRNENKICDNVCNNLMSVMSNNVWKECIATLERTNFEGVVETNAIPRYNRNVIDRLWTTYLDPSDSIIRYSLRPPLYIKLATLATEHNRHESLIRLGETLWNEARLCCPHKNNPSFARNKSSLPYNDIALRRFSVECQIDGWRGLGNQKMVSSLQRKHRRLLSVEAVDAVVTVTPSHAWDYETLRRHGEIQEDWEDGIPQEWRAMLHQWFQLARTTNVVVLDTRHHHNNNKDPLHRRTDCDEEQDDIIIVLSETMLKGD